MISVHSMRDVEKKANDIGIDDSSMMENAGANAAKIADKKFGLHGKAILIFCGTGNNAGDGLVFARHALILGADVRIYFVKEKKLLKDLAMLNYTVLKNLGLQGQPVKFYKKITQAVHADILVDAMLGIGIRGTVDEEYAKAILLFNSMRRIKISIDCPSGIDADTGKEMDRAVKPDITITFYDRKPGLDKKNCGQIMVADIGIPKI